MFVLTEFEQWINKDGECTVDVIKVRRFETEQTRLDYYLAEIESAAYLKGTKRPTGAHINKRANQCVIEWRKDGTGHVFSRHVLTLSDSDPIPANLKG